MDTEGQDLDVRFRDCGCPGTPHDDGDFVTMRPALGFTAGAEAYRMMLDAVIVVAATGGGKDGTEPIVDTSRTAELVGPVYIREGAIGWNVVDDNGPVPFDPQVILDDYTWAYPVAMFGDQLYSDAVTAPLVRGMNAPSRNGRNGASTRHTQRSSRKAPSQRKPSSPNGSVGPPSVTVP